MSAWAWRAATLARRFAATARKQGHRRIYARYSTTRTFIFRRQRGSPALVRGRFVGDLPLAFDLEKVMEVEPLSSKGKGDVGAVVVV